MTALREDRPWSPADSAMTRLANCVPYDADAFRALLETVFCLALPQEVIQRPASRMRSSGWGTWPRRQPRARAGRDLLDFIVHKLMLVR
jgi:hypothetical protein